MTLGETLREARERKGITVDHASAETRIREKFLRALESGDHASLPSSVYAKGFLRSYGDYLGLESDELVALYQAERGGPEPAQQLEPIRPIMRRGLVFTPVLLLPVVFAGAVVLFAAFLYNQFVSFVVAPRLEVTDPATDMIVEQPEIVLRGITVPGGRVTVTIAPGPARVSDVRADADGRFAVTLRLRPGANQIRVEVVDASGKVNSVERIVRVESVGSVPAPPELVVDEPAEGASFADGQVLVAGRTEPTATLLVNEEAVAVDSDGRFQVTLSLPQGEHAVSVVARGTDGTESRVTRSVAVAFTQAVVTVEVRGGEAWLLVTVDGATDPRTGRTYPDGSSLTFAGRQVVVRTGNAGATYLTVNGRDEGSMGGPGQVREVSFSAP